MSIGESPATPESWAVTDLESLAWTMRKIATARSRIAERQADVERLRERLRAELADVDAWADHVNADDVRTIERMQALAIDYLARQQAEDIARGDAPRVKSLSTPWGTVRSRQAPPRIEREEVVLREWARANGYVREIEPPVDWAGIRRASVVRGDRLVLVETGEIIPGCHVTEQGRSYDVEVP